MPISKILLKDIGPTLMAAFLYLGAGIGIGILSFVLLKEQLSWMYFIALIVMIGGSALVVADTLAKHHSHEHTHTFTHTHDGSTHMHTVTHSHEHTHYVTDHKHGHRHSAEELERLLTGQNN